MEKTKQKKNQYKKKIIKESIGGGMSFSNKDEVLRSTKTRFAVRQTVK